MLVAVVLSSSSGLVFAVTLPMPSCQGSCFQFVDMLHDAAIIIEVEDFLELLQ